MSGFVIEIRNTGRPCYVESGKSSGKVRTTFNLGIAKAFFTVSEAESWAGEYLKAGSYLIKPYQY